METFQKITRLIMLLAALMGLTACSTTPMNKQEAAAWYRDCRYAVRWVGYQGSDAQFHYFIARVMDEWKFIRINRAELKLDDEKPLSRASTAPLCYYLVDPSQDYKKIESGGAGKTGGPSNSAKVFTPRATPEGTYVAACLVKLSLNEDGTYTAEDLTQPTVVWIMEGNKAYPEHPKKLPPHKGNWVCDSATGDITLSPATWDCFVIDLRCLHLQFHKEDPNHLFINPKTFQIVPNTPTQDFPFLARQ